MFHYNNILTRLLDSFVNATSVGTSTQLKGKWHIVIVQHLVKFTPEDLLATSEVD